MVLEEKKFIYNFKIHKDAPVLIATFSISLGKQKDNYLNCKIWNKIFIAEIEEAQREVVARKNALTCTISGYLETSKYNGKITTYLIVKGLIIHIVPVKLSNVQKDINATEEFRKSVLEENKL